MFKLLSIALFAVAPSVHAASLYCVADGLTHNIRAINASAQADGWVKVSTVQYEYLLPSITVKGSLDSFEVLAEGADRVLLVKTAANQYVLQSLTYNDEKTVIASSVDDNVWCKKAE